MVTLPPKDPPTPQESIGIDSGLNAITTMVPSVSKEQEDSCPQVILKFYHLSSPPSTFSLKENR